MAGTRTSSRYAFPPGTSVPRWVTNEELKLIETMLRRESNLTFEEAVCRLLTLQRHKRQVQVAIS